MSIINSISNIFKSTGHNPKMSYTPSHSQIDAELLKGMTFIDFKDILEILAKEGVSIRLINDVLATKKLVTLATQDSVQSFLQRCMS